MSTTTQAKKEAVDLKKPGGEKADARKPRAQKSRAQKSREQKSGPRKSSAQKPQPQKPQPQKLQSQKPQSKKRPARAPRSRLKREEIVTIFERFAEIQPEPEGELEHVNPYTLVVAVLLSAQATDAGVNKATRALFQVADTPEKMLALGEDAVREHIKTIGLFRNKAKNVILMSQKLLDEHGGVVPEDRDALEQLPGVGRKTANVVMNMAFGHATMAVDTHVFRVANRTGLAPGKDVLQVEEGLLRVVPDVYGVHAHHWLILHGRYLCKARKPECYRCPIAEFCKFKDKTPTPG